MASDTIAHNLGPNAWVDISDGATYVAGVCLTGTCLLYYGEDEPDIKTPHTVPLYKDDPFSFEMGAGTLWAKSGDDMRSDIRVIRRED